MNLPELPQGWAYRPLKRVANIRFSSVDKHSLPEEAQVRLCNYLDVYRNDRITASLDFMNATATASERERFALRPGDVLLTKDSEDPLDIAIPACVVDALPGVLCGYHLALLRPNPGTMDGKFLHRTLTATGVRDQFFSRAVGVTRFAVGLGEVGDSLVPVPSLRVQRTIATFLDRKTAAIDALIAKKERQIELLQEKRQALITQAVTKGLDPLFPMKDSGVEWLGKIPAHWQVWKLGHSFQTIGSGTTPPTQERRYYDGDVPWVTTTELREAVITETQTMLTRLALHDHGTLRVYPPGTLLMAMYGATIGRLGVLGISACTNQACCAIARPVSLRPQFVYYWLQAYREQITALASGGGQPNINQEKIRAIRLAAPDLEDQDRIVNSLDRRVSRGEATIALIQDQVTRLCEYRQALISAAVTGKIDVSTEEAA